MFRHVAVAVVVCLSPAWLCAQTTTLTVSADSASVHKSPSTGGPVIGQAQRGSVLEVTRELGSWVRVSWPSAEDGAAYVHLSMGSLARNATPPSTRAAGAPSTRPAPEASPSAAHARVEVEQIDRRLTSIPPPATISITHAIGVGGKVAGMAGGTSEGFGASVRAWRRNRLGFQLEVARYSFTSDPSPDRLTSIQIEPSVLYLLRDVMTDYLWIRPYLGTGVHVRRLTMSSTTTGTATSTSDTGFGAQGFGGSELTFSGLPQFALSADLGYRWSRRPTGGFEHGGLGLTLSGHWYLR
jgi:hypothetical protein